MVSALFATDHSTVSGPNVKNTLTTQADLNETSLEQSMIDISKFTDERGLRIAARGLKNDQSLRRNQFHS